MHVNRTVQGLLAHLAVGPTGFAHSLPTDILMPVWLCTSASIRTPFSKSNLSPIQDRPLGQRKGASHIADQQTVDNRPFQLHHNKGRRSSKDPIGELY